jgi:hypothetical protein
VVRDHQSKGNETAKIRRAPRCWLGIAASAHPPS